MSLLVYAITLIFLLSSRNAGHGQSLNPQNVDSSNSNGNKPAPEVENLNFDNFLGKLIKDHLKDQDLTNNSSNQVKNKDYSQYLKKKHFNQNPQYQEINIAKLATPNIMKNLKGYIAKKVLLII